MKPAAISSPEAAASGEIVTPLIRFWPTVSEIAPPE